MLKTTRLEVHYGAGALKTSSIFRLGRASVSPAVDCTSGCAVFYTRSSKSMYGRVIWKFLLSNCSQSPDSRLSQEQQGDGKIWARNACTHSKRTNTSVINMWSFPHIHTLTPMSHTCTAWFSGEQMASYFSYNNRHKSQNSTHKQTPLHMHVYQTISAAFSDRQMLRVSSLIIYSMLKWEKRLKRKLHFQREKIGGWVSEKARQVFEGSETFQLDEQHRAKKTCTGTCCGTTCGITHGVWCCVGTNPGEKADASIA